MSNSEKYDKAFMEVLGLPVEQLIGLEYQATPSWDSVGHMQLMAVLEDTFDIFLETDDIIEFSSYEKGKVLLGKYGISF